MKLKIVVLIVVFAVVIAFIAYVVGVFLYFVKEMEDFGTFAIVYSDKQGPTIVIADRSIRWTWITGFLVDPEGRVRILTRLAQNGPEVLIDNWYEEIMATWGIAPPRTGVGLILAIDALDDQGQIHTLVAAVPIRIDLMQDGLMPIIALLPNYITPPRLAAFNETEGPPHWEAEKLTLRRENVTLAAVDLPSPLEAELTASKFGGFLGVGVTASSDYMTRFAGFVAAWFPEELEVRARHSDGPFSMLLEARVGVLAIHREGVSVRIPIVLPELDVEHGKLTLEPTIAPFGVANVTVPQAFERVEAGKTIRLESVGKKLYLGPGIWSDGARLSAFLAGPKFELQISSPEAEGRQLELHYTAISIKGDRLQVPFFII